MARKQNAVVATSALNAAQALVKAMLDVSDANLNIAALALDYVTDCADVDAVNKVRDEFKAAYAEGYKARYPSNDEEKCKNACNMAWSRVCAFAKDKGWDKPVAETAGAKKARDRREAKSSGKIDGRTEKKGAKVTGIVCEDEELREAFAEILKSEALQDAFFAWFDEATAATKVQQVRNGRKVA